MSSSEIQLIVPLSLLAGVKLLTPEAISEHLQQFGRVASELEERDAQLAALQGVFCSCARSISLILDEVDDPYEKAQALRKLSADMLEACQQFSSKS